MTEKKEKLKSEEQENQTQTNDSQKTQTEQVSGEVQNENQDQKDDPVEKPDEEVKQESHPSSENFKVPLDVSEKKYYENIVTAQAETIRKLRAENMELHSKLDSTKEE